MTPGPTTRPERFARVTQSTGLLTGALGSALVIGELPCAIGMLLIVLVLLIKMSQEEKLIMQTFPDTYPKYRTQVKALSHVSCENLFWGRDEDKFTRAPIRTASAGRAT